MTGKLKVVWQKPVRVSRFIGPQVGLYNLVVVEVAKRIAQLNKSWNQLGQIWSHRTPWGATSMNICACLQHSFLSAMTVFIIPELQLKRIVVAWAWLLRFAVAKRAGFVHQEGRVKWLMLCMSAQIFTG